MKAVSKISPHSRPFCDFMAEIGVQRCTFSFVTWYNKVKRRDVVSELGFYDPPHEQKVDLLSRMSGYAKERGIVLESCCNDALLEAGRRCEGELR